MAETKKKTGIYYAINAVMGEIGAIGKDKKSGQGFNFRGIDDLYNAVNASMVEHGLFCTPEVLERERSERPSKGGGMLAFTILKVKYTFYAPDGSSVVVVTIGEGMDVSDKSTNKAMSGAHKYALLQLFCIPTIEKKDSEHENPEPDALPTQSPAPAPAPAKPPVEKLTPEASAEKLQELEIAINECINIFNLKNWWIKHTPEIDTLTEDDSKTITAVKNRMKADFDNQPPPETPDPEPF